MFWVVKSSSLITKLEKQLIRFILTAHPNVRLFMTHAGLLSTQEAIYHAVPIIAFPVFGDQDQNARQAERAGIGIFVELLDVSEATLEDAIHKVLSDSGYVL